MADKIIEITPGKYVLASSIYFVEGFNVPYEAEGEGMHAINILTRDNNTITTGFTSQETRDRELSRIVHEWSSIVG